MTAASDWWGDAPMDRTTNGDGKPSELRADVCIVGGGPAGLTLALLLLRSGAEVALIERSASLDREFRGEILQPGGLALLDELGVLEGAVARGGYPLDRFRLQEDGRTLLDIDYRRLPGPHNHMLSIPQRHLLEELLTSCRAYPGFVHLEGHRATALLRSGGTVIGAVARSDAGSSTVHALCVVGADGRYSKVRRLAGIEAGRIEAFDFDVLWLKVPAPGGRRTPLPRDCGKWESPGPGETPSSSTRPGRTAFRSAGPSPTARTPPRWTRGSRRYGTPSPARFRTTPTLCTRSSGR